MASEMTPERVAELRAKAEMYPHVLPHWLTAADVLALCDALTTTAAISMRAIEERDAARSDLAQARAERDAVLLELNQLRASTAMEMRRLAQIDRSGL